MFISMSTSSANRRHSDQVSITQSLQLSENIGMHTELHGFRVYNWFTTKDACVLYCVVCMRIFLTIFGNFTLLNLR